METGRWWTNEVSEIRQKLLVSPVCVCVCVCIHMGGVCELLCAEFHTKGCFHISSAEGRKFLFLLTENQILGAGLPTNMICDITEFGGQ